MNDMMREDLLALVTNKEGWTRRDKEPAMRRVKRKNVVRLVVIMGVLAIGTGLPATASAQTIVDEWANVKLPPPPELKSVTINPKEKGIKTVIVVGTAAEGAALNTAAGSALRGFKVIVPVDGVSSATTFAELYTAWHLANAPRIGPQVTLTRIELIGY